jgi:hypothetical protein
MRYIFILILSVCLSRELTAAATWMELTPTALPTERSGASMAFDPATGQLILVTIHLGKK